jgi:hypothetical protein
MIYNTVLCAKNASNARFKVFIFVLCFLGLAELLFCPGCFPDRSPPDLSSCTRIEIRYPWSTLDYFLPSSGIQDTVLSPKEKVYIESIEFFTVNDPERIKAFAHDVSMGSYGGSMRGMAIDAGTPVVVDCYRDNEHIISFTVFANLIIAKNGRIFKYPRGLPNLEIIEPPEMLPFKLRFQCAWNMQNIYTAGPLYRRKVDSYPESAEWCDAVMRDRTNTSYVSEERMKGHFKCPTAGEGKCHYAMNPNCKPDSPSDTVFLFETKAGWNQHGGPELFTFDNHEPRGGCVLLNDGTVKFIRTEEELNKLRWK